jgi:hypothetical protein
LVRKPGEERPLEELVSDRRIILELMLNKQIVTMWTGFKYGPVADCCEHSNEPSGFICGGEFLD